MDKELILEKSRKEQKDEGVIFAQNQGMRAGWFVGFMLYAVIVVAEAFWGKDKSVIWAATAIYWAVFSAYLLVYYRYTRKTESLVRGMISLIAALAGIVALASTYL